MPARVESAPDRTYVPSDALTNFERYCLLGGRDSNPSLGHQKPASYQLDHPRMTPLRIAPDPSEEREARPNKYAPRDDWDEIQVYYDAGHSVRECQAKFGFSRRSWNKAVIRGTIVPRPQALPLDEALVKGPRRNRNHLKRRLINAGVKQNRCEQCGIDSWRHAPLNVALHHINGDGTDNRRENLQMLCPNCHSLTENYGRK